MAVRGIAEDVSAVAGNASFSDVSVVVTYSTITVTGTAGEVSNTAANRLDHVT